MRKASFRYDRKSNAEKRDAMRQAQIMARDLSRSTGVPHFWQWSNGCYFVFTKDEAEQ